MEKPDTIKDEEAKKGINGVTYSRENVLINTSQAIIALYSDEDSLMAITAINLLEMLQMVVSLRKSGKKILAKKAILTTIGSAVSSITGDVVQVGVDIGKIAIKSASILGSAQGKILSGNVNIDTTPFYDLTDDIYKTKNKYCNRNKGFFGEMTLYLNDFFDIGERIGAFVDNTLDTFDNIKNNGIGILNSSGSPGDYLKARWEQFTETWERQFDEFGEMLQGKTTISLEPICNTLDTMVASLQELIGIQQDMLGTLNSIVLLFKKFKEQVMSIIKRVKELVSAAFTAGAVVGLISLSLVSLGALERLLNSMLIHLKNVIPPDKLHKISVILDTLDINVRNSILNGEISRIIGDNKYKAIIDEFDNELKLLSMTRVGYIPKPEVIESFSKKYSKQFISISETIEYIEMQKSDIMDLQNLYAREVEFDTFVTTGQVLKEQEKNKKIFNRKKELFCRYYKSKLCDIKGDV